MADQRVNGNLILIGSSGGTIALGCQPSGGGFTILLPTAIPQVGQALVISSVYNGNTATAVWGLPANGTVTSVGFSAPGSIFTVSGQPVTASGVIALGLATQTANTFFAGPTVGTAVPTFRPLTIGDIPATGTPSSTTFLRGDGSWSLVPIIATYVETFNGRSGTVTSQSGDYSYAQISGTPQLPITPVVPSHEWLNGYSSTTGMFSYSQPASADLSDSAALARLASPTFTGTVTLPAVSVTGALAYTTANPTFFSSTGTGAVVLATSPTITSATLAGSTTATNLHIMGILEDASSSGGSAGQVLTSTASGTQWVNFSNGPLTFAPVTHEFLTGYNSGTRTFSAAAPAASDLSNGTTGSGAVVLANAPTFTANPTFASQTGSGAVALAVGPAFTGTTTLVNIILTGTFADDSSSVGTAGQVLSSTGAGTLWATPTVAFNNVTSGTNAAATMTVGTGASLTFSGSGVVNANEIYGVVVSNTAPSAGQVLTATSSSAAQWSTPTASGAVNPGTSGQLTWYAATGSAVSGNANATISSGTLTLGQVGSVAGELTLSSTGAGSAVTLATYPSVFTPWTLTLPQDSGTSTYVLETDGAGNTSWVPPTTGGTGSVTAVSTGDFSPLFTSSVANPTSTPAISFAAISQSQNLVFASPDGSSGTPTFRALVDADLPGGFTGTGAVVLANAPTFTANPTFASQTGSGAVVLAVGPTLTGTTVVANEHITGTLADSTNSVGTSGYVLTSTGSGTLWAANSGGTIGGSIAATQIAFGTGSDTIGGSANLTWDDTNHIFSGLDGYLDEVTGTTSIAFDNAVSNHGLTQVTTVTGTPSFPLEWALAVTVPTHPYIYDSAFQVVDDTNLLLIAAKPLTDTESVTFSTGGGGFPFASIISFFRSTPNLAQVVGQTPGSTTWTFPYTTVAGDTIVVALGGVEHNITAVSVTDTQGNNYVQQGYALQAGGIAYVFLFVAEGTTPLVAGTDSITGAYTGGSSEDITLLELAPAGATLALASNNVIVSTNSGLGGTHITDQGGGGLAIAATDDNNYLSLSSSDVGGTLIADSGTTGMKLSVSGTAPAVYPVTSVDATDGTNTVYHGIFPIFDLVGTSITTFGFINGVNNITANAVSSTRYTLVLPNSSAIAEAASATATNNLGGTLTLANTSFGGTYITDSSTSGLNITSTGASGPGLQLKSTGAGVYITNTGASGIIDLDDQGTGFDLYCHGTSVDTTITLENNVTGSQGINILDNSANHLGFGISLTSNSAIFTTSTGINGTQIYDDGGYGISLFADSGGLGNASIFTTNNGAGGTSIQDNGGGGISITTQTVPGTIAINANNTISLTNSGSIGTNITDNGGGAITIKNGSSGTSGIELHDQGTGTGVSPFNNNTAIVVLCDKGGILLRALGTFGLITLDTPATKVTGQLDSTSTDFGGTITVSSSTTATYGFNANFTGTNAPFVVLTPTSDPTATGTYWVTVNGSTGAWTGFTVHVSITGTITFNYVVIGNQS